MNAARRRRRAPVRGGGIRVALGLGYVVVSAVLATVAAWPVYAAPRMLVVAAVGVVAGLGLAALAHALPWRGGLRMLLVVPATALAYALLVVPVAIPSALGDAPSIVRGIRDGAVGVVVGWKQLLTLSLPLGEYQAVLVPFFVVMLVGTLAAALLAVSARPWSPLAVPAAFAMTAFGLAFGSSTTSDPLVLGPVVVPAPRELLVAVGGLVAALAWLLLRARSARAEALRRATAGTVQRSGMSGWVAVRRRALAGVLVAFALVVGATVTPAAADLAERSALRDRVEPEVVLRQTPTPLSTYRAAFTAERIDEPWLSIEGDTGGIDRLRLATLDAYDGETFHVAAAQGGDASADTRFSRLPGASAGAGASDAEFRLEIGDGYSGIWVPVPLGLASAPDFAGPRAAALDDGFHRAADASTAIDIATSDAARRDARGLRPRDRYSVTATADRAGDLSALGSPQEGSMLDEEAHPALVDWVELQGQPATAAGFSELVDRLRARGYLSHATADGPDAAGWIGRMGPGYAFLPSYSGHSTARIEALFTQLVDQQRLAGDGASDGALVAGVGDDEQFAVAVALVARHLGYDSRVVLGFRLADAAELPGVDRCTSTCTGGALTAWTEVAEPGGPWVTVDATPQHAVAPSLIREGEQLPEHPTTPERPDTDTIDPPPAAQSDADDAAAPVSDDDALDAATLLEVLRRVGLALGAALCLVLPWIVLLAGKSSRTRRRRRASQPEVRVVAAWDELVDVYRDHGLLASDHAGRAETARLVGRPAAAALVAHVERAVFAADPPTTADAELAWGLVDAERADLRRATPFRHRIAAAVSLASFLRPFHPARRAAIPTRLEEPAR